MLIIIAVAVGVYLYATCDIKYVCMYAVSLALLPLVLSSNLVMLRTPEMLIVTSVVALLATLMLMKNTERKQRNSRIGIEPTILLPSENEISSTQNDDDISNIKMKADREDRLVQRSNDFLAILPDDNRQKKTVTGVLKDFGVAYYLHNPKNKRSFYVRVDDTVVWGLGLADAIANSSVQKGDSIVLQKEKEIVVEFARVIDENGNRITSERLSVPKRRGYWSITPV